MIVQGYLERNADDDEQQVGGGQAGEEHVSGGLHAAVPEYGEDDEGVAGDPQEHGQ